MNPHKERSARKEKGAPERAENERPPLLSGGGWCGRGRGGCVGAVSVIHQVLQLLAGLEERDFLRRHFDAIAGFRISSHARFALACAEAAEAADFDLVSNAK
jgi:hypothetical protein